jgi:glyoxylase-like metal-dependent hydrolase (beta-lactamase superfamily II)
MKRLLTLILLVLRAVCAFAQEELHIHHINVEDGDATFIGIYHMDTHLYSQGILIDGGNSNPDQLLLPYLKSVMNTAQPKFNYVALTHYHKDHYND